MRPVENLSLPDFKDHLKIGTRVAVRPCDYSPVALEATVVALERNMMGSPLYEVEIKQEGEKEKRTTVFYASELEHDPSRIDRLLKQAAEY
jgi:hypothetical protein